MKWLKAKPQTRIEETIKEKPLLHACCGEHKFGDVTVDIDPSMHPDYIADVRSLPFGNNKFAAAFMDCPWTASWKKNVADAMRELLRVAPVVYVLSPWIYGSSSCEITDIYIAYQPGVNQTLSFVRYKRKET